MKKYPRNMDLTSLSYKIGIYYLYKDNEIVYIGSSKTLGFRIIRHKVGKSGKYKKFDSFSYKLCSEQKLLEVEARAIFKHTPIHNQVLPICKFNSNDEYRAKKALKIPLTKGI